MNAETVPTRFANSLLNLVLERGYDYSGMLTVAGIDFDPRKPRQSDYRQEITAMQYSKLYQQVLSLLQDETFGLSFGQGVTPGAFRMMCYCILGCENLGVAIKRTCEFYRTFFDADAQITMSLDQELVIVGYRGSPAKNGIATDAMPEVEATDAYSLSVWHRFFCWLTGRSMKLSTVHFRGAAPATEEKIEKYQQLFNCPIHYGQQRDEIIFAASYLTSPLVHTEQSLKDFLRTAPYQLMVINPDASTSSLVTRVRALIGHDFSQGFPSFEKITDSLNMSAPTLRRKLKKEGTTFQQLKDECRRDASLAYLSNPDLSINAVAALMGFTDPSAFHRSFKKWTAMTPGEFRQQEHSESTRD
ncbi:AraC family transcriptional regulator [Oceanicoccus sp. KOV_DT_Chl]|uniref:AraC family transcriptional regulator n=1 Tax=Oceanicoccus sp. KOV_DT_Chl TaxID=1904639 RepID=UPI000C7CF568|nr:AraC family transcriptional regulator [Oceanicoccus sp. KOV_DT_Chl]